MARKTSPAPTLPAPARLVSQVEHESSGRVVPAGAVHDRWPGQARRGFPLR